MTWKKKTLLALLGVTALVGVAASASAEDWDFSFWSPQATYVSHEDRDRGENNGYYGQYYHSDQNRDWSNRSYGTYDSNRGYNRDNDGERSWYRSYDNGYGNGYGYNGYVQQDRGEHQYGEHRDRDESDDDE